jgi:hypothetical protein
MLSYFGRSCYVRASASIGKIEEHTGHRLVSKNRYKGKTTSATGRGLKFLFLKGKGLKLFSFHI